jgi:hypothetical protein
MQKDVRIRPLVIRWRCTFNYGGNLYGVIVHKTIYMWLGRDYAIGIPVYYYLTKIEGSFFLIMNY